MLVLLENKPAAYAIKNVTKFWEIYRAFKRHTFA